jgi:hypothetical protein
VSYETDLHQKDGAWVADATIAGGVDDIDNTHPLNCTTDGTLEVQVSGTDAPIDVIVDNIVPVSQSGTWTVAATQSGLWSVSIVPSATGVNLFATNDSVPYGIETVILTYTPIVAFHITQIIGWGMYDGEFLLRVNGVIVGGGRTSAAERTLDIEYETAAIPTNPGDVITITILEYGPGLQQFRANLLGE